MTPRAAKSTARARGRRSGRRAVSRRIRRAPRPPSVIPIDGPSGAGKSSASRLLAERLGWRVFETGGLYRAVAWSALKSGVDPDDRTAVGRLCARLALTLSPVAHIYRSKRGHTGPAGWRIRVGKRTLTRELRGDAVTAMASRVAALPAVRRRLLRLQRALVREGRVVMEGRDIGTVVCPAAPAKFFLDADPSVRGRRRFQEQAVGRPPARRGSVRQVLSAISERDRRDQGRRVAPLRPAPDAVRIDTTGLTLEQVVDKMMTVLNGRGIPLSFERLRRGGH
ncbi:MAG TPA: (d)CMP kinase [Nitrospiria bacterium]|nr:(d)CMP kinase [Nitrospiria bacterium]